MARLPRPHIPVEVKLRVALAGLGEIFINEVIEQHKGGLQAFLEQTLIQLAAFLLCAPGDLDLDHNPPLAARERILNNGEIVGYKPDANDPDFLRYRERRAHKIKTNVRGDGAQYPDRVLIKRRRKHERRDGRVKRKREWAKRSFAKGSRKIPRRVV